jgi:ABC-type oligopeptide transport system ATPase subunit
MAKGTKLDEKTKGEIRKAVEAGTMLRKDIAAMYEIHPTMISKVMNSKSPKRKVKRAVKADATWETLFNEYIEARNAAQQALKDSEVAKKKLEAFVKGLK